MESRISLNPPSGLLSPLALVLADAVALSVQALTVGGFAGTNAPFREGKFLLVREGAVADGPATLGLEGAVASPTRALLRAAIADLWASQPL